MTALSYALTGIIAVVAALIAVLVYHVTTVKPALARTSAMLSHHDDLIGGGAGAASTRLAALESGRRQSEERERTNESRLAELEALAQRDLSRIGFVRYDAFDDTGSDLSYALALLNRDGDGVVLTSLYSRSETRTFGKGVAKFTPTVNASEEELRAIELARQNPT